MTRIRAVLFLALVTLLLPLLFLHFVHALAATAVADATTAASTKKIGVVADTTTSMTNELTMFSNAWQSADFDHTEVAMSALTEITPAAPATHCDPICPPLTATFQLVTFRDIAQYEGGSTNYSTFGQQISNLPTDGGGACPDNALSGLRLMAQNMESNSFLSNDVALLTDATPRGDRANYMFIINRMLRRGINVHSLVSGWCAGASVPEQALEFLTQATGGQYYRSVNAADYITESLMVQDKLFATDMLLSQDGTVSSGTPDIIPLKVDSSTYGVSVEMYWTGCLTCPLASPTQQPSGMNATAALPLQIELRDPDGNVVTDTAEGFANLTTSQRQLVQYYPASAADLKDGEWEIRVSGDGDYNVIAVSKSRLHMTYLGPGSIPINQQTAIRVAVKETTASASSLEAPADVALLAIDFQLVPANGVGTPQSISLFDDGAHNDGAAGDGIYGGMVQPNAAGWWRISAAGQLDDTTSFQRLTEIPIRVQGYRITESKADTAVVGATRQVSFTLSSDALTTTSSIDIDSGAAPTSTTFDLALFSEQGWTVTDTIPVSVTLAPGETFTVTTDVVIPANAPEGSVEESTFVAVDINDVEVGLTAVTETEVVYEKIYLPVIIKE